MIKKSKLYYSSIFIFFIAQNNTSTEAQDSLETVLREAKDALEKVTKKYKETSTEISEKFTQQRETSIEEYSKTYGRIYNEYKIELKNITTKHSEKEAEICHPQNKPDMIPANNTNPVSKVTRKLISAFYKNDEELQRSTRSHEKIKLYLEKKTTTNKKN